MGLRAHETSEGGAGLRRPVGVLDRAPLGWRDALAVLLLMVGVAAVFGRTIGYDYVNLDDPLQVKDNEVVRKGLTWEGVRYAFRETPEGNFMPVIWLSHMAVVEFTGGGPAGHHALNVALHAVGAALVYLFWRLATGAVGPSLIVAGLFAVHPLRAESVAWIAERKDVLSGVFWMLTLLAYLRYTRAPSVGRYLIVALVYAVGLLAKSMLVTIPCVLLLLDFWPLGRFERGRVLRLVVEKLPLFGLSAGCAVMTFYAQKSMGAVSSIQALPLASRLWNAPASYAKYLAMTVWPSGLAVQYPYPPFETLRVAGAVGLVVVGLLTVAVVLRWRARPYLAMGWFWYLGTMVPVIGLVQVGSQSHADRYTYIPHIGLLAGLVWTVDGVIGSRGLVRRAAGGLAAAVIVLLGVACAKQSTYWKDSLTLFSRSLAVTRDNAFSEGMYASALIEAKRYAEAEAHLRRVMAMGRPTRWDYHNMGLALYQQKNLGEAQYFFELATLEYPNEQKSWLMLARVRADRGAWLPAAEAYKRAVGLGANSWETRLNLGIALGMANQAEEAKALFAELVKERPDDARALYNYGLAFVQQRDFATGLEWLERAVKQDSAAPDAWYYLGVCQVWQGQTREALSSLRAAVGRDPALRAKAKSDPFYGILWGLGEFKAIVLER